MFPRSGLLIAYDAECSFCCRVVGHLRRRDRQGRLVFFPLQNRELALLAPELAGLPLQGDVHAVDLESREVWGGADLIPRALARLPRWRWVSPLLRFPVAAWASRLLWRRQAEARVRKFGRQPFRDRFD
ncbi:MAG: DUF393 domain-containing protein [Acidobacteria bacterium]|nr:DUF393 domain-containing protein [Acidobacteriota bacterium]